MHILEDFYVHIFFSHIFSVTDELIYLKVQVPPHTHIPLVMLCLDEK